MRGAQKAMHPLVAALLGALGGVFDAQALQVRMGQPIDPSIARRVKHKTGHRWHSAGGDLAVRRAARKRRNVIRNRRAHRG